MCALGFSRSMSWENDIVIEKGNRTINDFFLITKIDVVGGGVG